MEDMKYQKQKVTDFQNPTLHIRSAAQGDEVLSPFPKSCFPNQNLLQEKGYWVSAPFPSETKAMRGG